MAANTSDWSLYPYRPNQVAPIAFAAIITLLAVILFYLSFIRYQWKKFGAMMIWASSMWIGGFVCRSISVREPQNIGLFLAQYVMIFFGPMLYAAAEYFILDRLLAYLPYHSPIHPGRVFSTFAFLSAVADTLAAYGSSTSASATDEPSKRALGLTLLKVSLILQCVIELSFASLVALLEYRCRKAKTFPQRVRTISHVLYITSAMMMVRCLFRLVEGFEASSCDLAAGAALLYCGTINLNEWFLWVFEVANITIFVMVLCIFHPGRYLPPDTKIYLDPIDAETERLGPGFSKASKKPLLQTFIDPFDFIGILTGKGMESSKFWEEEYPRYTGEGNTRVMVRGKSSRV